MQEDTELRGLALGLGAAYGKSILNGRARVQGATEFRGLALGLGLKVDGWVCLGEAWKDDGWMRVDEDGGGRMGERGEEGGRSSKKKQNLHMGEGELVFVIFVFI